MEQNNPTRIFLYVGLLSVFFLVLFSLDRIFGLHYAPNEHHLNEVAEYEANHPSVKAEPEPSKSNQKASTTHDEIKEGSTEHSNKTEPEIKLEKTSEPQSEKPSETKPSKDITVDKQKYFSDLLQHYKSEVLSKLPAKQARKDVVLRYYHHAPDGNSAYALEKLGFYIHERPVTPEYEDYQSNAIYYGDSVSDRDIQLVSYTLLKEGLPIKVIKPSKFGDSWKSKSIEIGTDTTLVNHSTIELEDIVSFER